MAIWDMDQFHARSSRRGAADPPRVAERYLRKGAALLSAALAVGLVVWGWQAMRVHVNGIPVLRAPEGQARVAPDNPGGELAQHQGLAVNQIASEGTAAETAEQLTLAPRPAELLPVDTASAELTVSGGTTLAIPDTFQEPNRAVTPSETVAAMQPAPGQLSVPLPDNVADPVDDPEAMMAATDLAVAVALGLDTADIMAEPAAAPATLAGGALASSPVPPIRAAAGGRAGQVAGQAAAGQAAGGGLVPDDALSEALSTPIVADKPLDADPAALPSGTVLAQIGSYDSADQARAAWDRAAETFGALMSGRQRVIQEVARSSGSPIYRLRVAGFENLEDARRFCAAVRTATQCVPTQVR